jgi:hypothetical protein
MVIVLIGLVGGLALAAPRVWSHADALSVDLNTNAGSEAGSGAPATLANRTVQQHVEQQSSERFQAIFARQKQHPPADSVAVNGRFESGASGTGAGS